MEAIEAFAVGWCVSLFWSVIVIPIILVKASFTLPFD